MRLLPSVSAPLTVSVLVTIVAEALTYVAAVLTTGALVDGVVRAAGTGLGSPETDRVVAILVIKAGLYVISNGLDEVRGMLIESLGRKTDGALRDRLMAATLGPAGIEHLEDPATLDRIRDAQGIGTLRGITAWDAVRGMATNVSARLTSVAAALVLVSFRWWLPIALLGFSVLVRYRLVGDRLRAAQSRTGKVEPLRRADYFRDLAMTPSAAKETRVFGLGAWIRERHASHWSQGMHALWRERKEHRTKSWLVGGAWGAIVFGGLLQVGHAAVEGEITVGRVTMLAPAILSAGVIWIGQSDIWASLGTATVRPILELERSRSARLTQGTRDPTGSPRDSIVLDQVRFRYPGRDGDVFSDLSLRIPAGRSLALVGPNGAGKTTLVKLLARLYDPSEGTVSADGVDVREFDLAAWRSRLGIIFQDFVRYEMSVADNVSVGAIEWRDDTEMLRSAASRAGALDFIEALPHGWSSVLSREYRDGVDLSGGQWQRIALARALFAVEAGAGVLVLDEPTAHLDVRAEAEVFDRFMELTAGTTTILISHRFSSVRHADLICVLDEGRIIEQGSHEELLATGGPYSRMFLLQASRFTDPVEEVSLPDA